MRNQTRNRFAVFDAIRKTLTFDGVLVTGDLEGFFPVIMGGLFDTFLQNPLGNPLANKPVLQWFPSDRQGQVDGRRSGRGWNTERREAFGDAGEFDVVAPPGGPFLAGQPPAVDLGRVAPAGGPVEAVGLITQGL